MKHSFSKEKQTGDPDLHCDTFQKAGVALRYQPPKNGVHPNKELGWMRRLLPIAKSHKKSLYIGLITGLIALVLNVAVPAMARNAIDAALEADRESLTTWAIVLISVGVGRFIFGSLYRYSLFQLAWGVETDLRTLLYSHLTKLSFSYFDRTQSGEVISRANSDIRSIQVLLAFGPLIGMTIISFVLAFGYMMTLHVPLTLVSLLTLPGVYFFGQKLRRVVFPLTWVSQARLAELATIVDENVNGIRVVKSFAAEKHQVGLLQRAAEHIKWVNVEAIRARAKYNPVIESLPRVGMALVLLYGGHLAIEGSVSIGTLFAFNAYVIMLQAPFRMFGFLLLQTQRASASAQRIFEVIDEEPTVVNSENATHLVDVQGSIVFEDVYFTYPSKREPSEDTDSRETDEVLSGFNLTISPGETVAIVGRTGSGKSTIGRLLNRFYDPTSGKILVDGKDIRDVTLDSLRHQIGIVFDEPFLFSSSIAENIAYSDPDASLEEISSAAEASEASDFIQELSEGYDTVVGERGYTLSGGQRQRISLARTLLEKTPILVLDDATSAIDVEIEAKIHDALTKHLSGRTTILIAQRVSTISLADRVVLVEDGVVVADGTHSDLMANDHRYVSILAEAEKKQKE